MTSKPRVIHFVTGGGSGATKVALELACGHLRTGNCEPLLVLRRKQVPLPAPMQAQITATGLRTAWVANGWKRTILRQLAAIIAEFQPQVFAAHGNSEHLWGRQAAFAASVPVVLHVEQNCERYPFWRRWAAQRLAARTTATVCVSRGVADHVRHLGLAGPRLEVIHNGIDASRYSVGAPPFASRSQDIVMVARFARQKDQPTLIRAAKRLVDSGWTGQLLLGGDGKPSHRRACEKLTRSLGLAGRVEFLGRVAHAAELYHRCRAAVLSTHYEGLPLVLVDYMAAGCAAIGSDAAGVNDVIEPGVNGWRFPRGDDAALARILTMVLAGGPAVEAIVARGQADAPANFSLQRMIARYESLFAELLAGSQL
ncbi:MAG: glycosyltransferase [Lacunisphaera sp.]|jgi:glycosyltransferase involved in cell wall biosynthesis|nr:glycosyltransferase [Lacunisphaera sp.]